MKIFEHKKFKKDMKKEKTEDMKSKKKFEKLLKELKIKGQKHENLETKRMISLSKTISEKYLPSEGLEMIAESKIGGIMDLIIKAWNSVVGKGRKFLGQEKSRQILMECVFLAVNDKFVYNDHIPNCKQRRELVEFMKENL